MTGTQREPGVGGVEKGRGSEREEGKEEVRAVQNAISFVIH